MTKELKQVAILVVFLGVLFWLLPPVAVPQMTPVVASDQILTPEEFSRWYDKLVEAGVIDPAKFPKVQNVRSELNLLWALGLGQKSRVLEEGPMMDPKYGGPGGFASTGGWTLARGSAMDHYGQHHFLSLSPEQEELVIKTAKQIYRPCCANSTYFPDCNHGMAMLGLLEMMAAGGATESEMLKTASRVNELWFPELASKKSAGGCGV